MVQLRMHDDAPDIAVYAQHTHAREARVGRCRARRGPSGRLRGPRLARVLLRARLPHHRRLVRPRRRQAPRPRARARDPRGRRPGLGALAGPLGRHAAARPGGLHQPSPTGPGAKEQWSTPDWLLEKARRVQHGTAAAAPDVRIARAGDWTAHRLRLRAPRPAAALARGHGQLARRGGRAAADLHVHAPGHGQGLARPPASRPTPPSTTTSTRARPRATRRCRPSRR